MPETLTPPRVDQDRPVTGADLPRPAMGFLDPPVRHTLTIEFGGLLSSAEWRAVMTQVRRHVPYVHRMRADTVAG